ncbi:MAG: DUF302 domain-containing protein [Actinobacteria bacterium]|jgi:uncharacterized protein (DUF302 family)|uniref:Uncharacterized protein (DUF302 family) n=1 Tax=Nocardioides marinisabuli TaxID=419476 RepID=A0A7Y9JQY7_9ACTN|nr:DUF302 domain-containing protein [Nocardioides marinisabuli]MBU2073759.1 DUF302 domain-containing protein [Actinomycetota bacterium]MBU2112102.1 DUF302 domain-containing protein [Actinomycetota bacterium]NYD58642.1 uncharacterized protein (DUF302 family) [Nocardioides marinisabuli]
MTQYTLKTTVRRPYDETVEAVRAELSAAGFGILTEIDLKATLKAKLDVDVAPQVILGACRPELAHQALQAEPSIAALLPCNVVVRAVDDTTTIVEAFDADAMMSFAADDRAGDTLRTVATHARQRLTAALAALENN